MSLEQLLLTKYEVGGRGPTHFDCWGLVRQARADLFNRQLLPLLADAIPGNVRSITKAVDHVERGGWLQVEDCRPGAIATAWRASLCVHVGIVVVVDGRTMILETDQPTGPCLTKIATFAGRYSHIKYYDDLHLSQPNAR